MAAYMQYKDMDRCIYEENFNHHAKLLSRGGEWCESHDPNYQIFNQAWFSGDGAYYRPELSESEFIRECGEK